MSRVSSEYRGLLICIRPVAPFPDWAVWLKRDSWNTMAASRRQSQPIFSAYCLSRGSYWFKASGTFT